MRLGYATSKSNNNNCNYNDGNEDDNDTNHYSVSSNATASIKFSCTFFLRCWDWKLISGNKHQI